MEQNQFNSHKPVTVKVTEGKVTMTTGSTWLSDGFFFSSHDVSIGGIKKSIELEKDQKRIRAVGFVPPELKKKLYSFYNWTIDRPASMPTLAAL